MTTFATSTLLVTGANGQLGRLVVEELIARGAQKIVAGTRDLAALKSFADRGVEVRHLDFDDPASLQSAFAGIERALLISTVAPNRTEQQAAAAQAAKAVGVSHLIYTSGPNARPNLDLGGITDHYWTEQAVAATGLDFTILRNHIYTDMLLMSAPQALASGQSFDATDGKGRNYVTRADIARTAAGALLTAAGKEIFDVTGPAPQTQAEIADLYAKITGKPVARIGASGPQLLEGLQSAGVPPFMAQLLVAFDLDAAQGFHAVTTDAVQRFAGRAPETVESFLNANKAALLG